jgi:hypothetical protein
MGALSRMVDDPWGVWMGGHGPYARAWVEAEGERASRGALLQMGDGAAGRTGGRAPARGAPGFQKARHPFVSVTPWPRGEPRSERSPKLDLSRAPASIAASPCWRAPTHRPWPLPRASASWVSASWVSTSGIMELPACRLALQHLVPPAPLRAEHAPAQAPGTGVLPSSADAGAPPLLPHARPPSAAVRRASDRSPLPVVATAGGKHYCLSEEGCEYVVEVVTDHTFPTTTIPGLQHGVSRHRERRRPAAYSAAPRAPPPRSGSGAGEAVRGRRAGRSRPLRGAPAAGPWGPPPAAGPPPARPPAPAASSAPSPAAPRPRSCSRSTTTTSVRGSRLPRFRPRLPRQRRLQTDAPRPPPRAAAPRAPRAPRGGFGGPGRERRWRACGSLAAAAGEQSPRAPFRPARAAPHATPLPPPSPGVRRALHAAPRGGPPPRLQAIGSSQRPTAPSSSRASASPRATTSPAATKHSDSPRPTPAAAAARRCA